ncbi:MAG: biotin--[acetyl-CoA-carboxylase] ligase [Chloroflexi bacterium]|nr:biotin--[acetyl-CoA-carboxylase] ligase [Chloroflexota bacterium]
MTAARLQAALGERAFRYYDQVGSTNDLAHDWLLAGAQSGGVIIADEQVSGRGRMGRGWYAPPGTALMLSMVLHPGSDVVGRVNLLGGVAVCEALEALGARDVGLKWPNDVWLQRRKVCGVLAEAHWQADRLIGAILGMGINVRVDFAGTPFADTAISLETVTGPVDRLTLLTHLLARLDHWRAPLASDALFEAWRARLQMIGDPVAIKVLHETISGIAAGVTPDGALLVRQSDGSLRAVAAGDLALGGH